MKIIKEGIPHNRVTCQQCDCVFEYEPQDIYEKDNIEWSGWRFVDCPHCGRRITVAIKLPPLRGIENGQM